MAGSGGNELRASVEIDWSKATAKLQEIDRQQKTEDQKAEVLERRARKLSEQFRDIEQRTQDLDRKVGNRIGDMLKDFGKFTAKAVVFDTLTQFSDIIPEQARGIAGVAVTGLSAAATSGNPLVGALAAMAKTVDVLRDAQRAYQQELEAFRRDIEKREEETQRTLERLKEQRIKDQLRLEQELGQIRIDVAKEGSELLQKTWAMTA